LLFLTDKKAQAVGRLAVSEYEALVAAFAQAGAMPGERERGTAVVRKYQQQRRWFGCDCLGAGEGTPILVPVAEAHIRRDPTHPDHADGCPFELDAHDRLLRARCANRSRRTASSSRAPWRSPVPRPTQRASTPWTMLLLNATTPAG
jgi:hypothetical protein